MISGVDYKKRTRLRFVIYAVLAGPLVGYGLFWSFVFLGEGANFADTAAPDFENNVNLVQLVYFIGFFPALFTALYLGWHFKLRGGLTNISVVVLTLFAYGGLTLISGVLAYSAMGSDGLVVPLTAGLVSIFSVATTLILWFVRPRGLIGPMTKKELEAWRAKQ